MQGGCIATATSAGPLSPKQEVCSTGVGCEVCADSREKARAGANASIIWYASAAQSLSSFYRWSRRVCGQTEALRLVILQWSERIEFCVPDSSIPTAAIDLRGACGLLSVFVRWKASSRGARRQSVRRGRRRLSRSNCSTFGCVAVLVARAPEAPWCLLLCYSMPLLFGQQIKSQESRVKNQGLRVEGQGSTTTVVPALMLPARCSPPPCCGN